MTAASYADIGKSNLGTDRFVGRNRQVCRHFDPVMRAARGMWRSKVAAELAVITGKSVRTCERWLAGEVTPDGESTLALTFSSIGPKLIAAGVSQLPPARQAAFWREMAKAARRAELIAQRAEIERELAEAGQ